MEEGRVLFLCHVPRQLAACLSHRPSVGQRGASLLLLLLTTTPWNSVDYHHFLLSFQVCVSYDQFSKANNQLSFGFRCWLQSCCCCRLTSSFSSSAIDQIAFSSVTWLWHKQIEIKQREAMNALRERDEMVPRIIPLIITCLLLFFFTAGKLLPIRSLLFDFLSAYSSGCFIRYFIQ